ncbi:MAG: hypothetical protein AB1918_13365 [Pseudomonadota bacterium]
MSDDTVPMPPHLAGEGRVLYKGVWLSEIRQPVELKGVRNAVLREIWVRLPSGRDKKWQTHEPTFSALEGHQVGALVCPSTTGGEFLVGMVNYATGEKRAFWAPNRPGLGCALWMILFLALMLVEGGAAWRLYLWLAAFVGLSGLTLVSSRRGSQERKRDGQRLEYLAGLDSR